MMSRTFAYNKKIDEHNKTFEVKNIDRINNYQDNLVEKSFAS
jgi:hypothetical protein